MLFYYTLRIQWLMKLSIYQKEKKFYMMRALKKSEFKELTLSYRLSEGF